MDKAAFVLHPPGRVSLQKQRVVSENALHIILHGWHYVAYKLIFAVQRTFKKVTME